MLVICGFMYEVTPDQKERMILHNQHLDLGWLCLVCDVLQTFL